MKFMLIAMMFVSTAYAENWDGRIYKVKNQTIITESEYTRELSHFSIIVLGEKHYTTAVQRAQAKTIQDVVALTGKQNAFTTGWEFLNVTSQNETDLLFSQYKEGKITPEKFFEITQGKTPSMSYAPILEVTATLGGNLLGVNLSRAEKAPVTERGIEALDPKLLPPGFEHGTRGYFERFKEVMQGHATPEQISNYYDSQCLVDDVIAYHLLGDKKAELKFLVVGSFHSDFYDGAVNRIKVRDPETKVASVKIVDASDFKESELKEILPDLLRDSQYGDVADYVYFVNSPK